MTNKQISENKETKEQIQLKEVENVLKNVDEEKYLYPNSDKVFNNISNFYLLNKKSHEIISSISSKFLISSFSLEYLNLLNKLIEIKYEIPQLTLKDFEDVGKIKKVKVEISKSQNEPYINWLTEECLTELIDTIDNLVIEDIENLNKLGHIIKLTINELQHDENLQDIELYDALYRFVDRLDNFEVGQKKQDISIRYSKIKKSKEGDSTEINCELRFGNKNVPAIRRILEVMMD